MKYIRIVLPPLMTNCYIIYNSMNGNCYIVDPASNANEIVSVLSKINLTPIGILLTHGHFDHIGACDDLRSLYKIPLYIHEDDAPMLNNPDINCSASFFRKPLILSAPDVLLRNNDILPLEEKEIKVIHTPGHSPGSVSFVCENFILSGDTIFRNSYGRFDLPGGNFNELKNSIKNLLSYDKNIKICPGHNEETTINDEIGCYNL